MAQTPTPQKLKSWSHTSLMTYEACPYQAWLKHGLRTPEIAGDTTAKDRGIMIHENAEHYVRGTANMIPELNHFASELAALAKLFKKGKVSLEGEWAYDRDWRPVDWRSSDAWARMKCDAVVFPDPYSAIVIDYKSGKRFGNEIKHGEQIHIYTIGLLLRYPKIQNVTTELWYTDQNDLAGGSFTREQAMKYLPAYTKRAQKMTETTVFPPRPNIFSCPRCPYGPTKGGQCKAGFSIQGLKTKQRNK